MSRAPLVAVFVCALLTLPPAGGVVAAQEIPENPLREARRLHAGGDHETAALYLRAYLRGRPDDPTAHRLLASVLEAGGDLEGARRQYEETLRLGPDDPLLRLDYGRILVELGQEADARDALEPVARSAEAPPRVRADAWFELGRLALASGDRAAAEADFRRALELEARHDAALDRLRALHRTRVPWLRLRGYGGRDDQPVRRYGGELEGGLRVLPWLSTELRAGTRRLRAGPVDETLTTAQAAVTGRWELLNLEGSLRGGAYRRSAAEEGDWSGEATLAFHGPAGTLARVQSRRAPYLLTAASLERPVTVVSVGGTVGRPAAAGWAGALTYREDRFSDFEPVEDAEGWILAPVVRDAVGTVRLGYRFHAAQSSETTFEPLGTGEMDPDGRVRGRYAPIYTPRELRSHNLLLDARHEHADGTLLAFDGSWGFEAEEEAPVLFPAVPGVPDAGTDLQLQRRSFTPWHARVRARFPVTPQLLLDLTLGYRRTAFRGLGMLEVAWTFHDLPAELR